MKNNPTLSSKPARSRRKKISEQDIILQKEMIESPQDMLRMEIIQLKEMARILGESVGNDLTVNERAYLLDVRGKTSTRIAALLKAVSQFGQDEDAMNVIREGLNEMIRELEEENK